MHHSPGLMHEIFKVNGAFISYYQLNPFYVINLGFRIVYGLFMI